MLSIYTTIIVIIASCVTVFKKSIVVGIIRQLYELITMLIMVKMHGWRYAGKIYSIVDEIESRFDKYPCTQFVTAETGAETSSAQIEDLANQVANWAHDVLALKQGNTVCLMSVSKPEFVSFWIGMSKIGVSTALLNTNITGKPFLHSVEVSVATSEHKIVVVDDDLKSGLTDDLKALKKQGARVILWSELMNLLKKDNISKSRPPRSYRNQIKESDPVIFIFTSGTTGLPKAAKISSTRMMMMTVPFRVMGYLDIGSRIYCCLPLYHAAGGVSGAAAALLSGATVVLRKRFSASNFSSDCYKYSCDSFQYIGELCRFLINVAPSEFDSKLRLKYVFGNGLRGDVWVPFQKRYNIERVVEFYSATEANVGLFNSTGVVGALGCIPRFVDFLYPVKIIQVDPDAPDTPMRDSKTGFCSNAAVNETGLVINQISMTNTLRRFEGYTDSAATSKKILRDVFEKGDMYFNSGDLLHRDWFGFFYWADRVGDTFRWKGENVATTEIEHVLNDVNFISDICCYGIEIPGCDGKAGMITITVKDGAAVDWKHYHTVCAAHLPLYARPLFIKIQKEMVMTATFKHQKNKMVKQGYTIDELGAGEFVYMYAPKDGAVSQLSQEAVDEINAGTIKF